MSRFGTRELLIWFRKISVFLIIITIGIASLVSGTDRISSDFPRSPSIEGWPYDVGAARSRAELALVGTGPASAMPHAKRAILSDPLDTNIVGLLGRSRLLAGDRAAAEAAFRVSGQLGWHDPLTQMYWMDQALILGDTRVAAERLDAVLRLVPNIENRDTLISILIQTPDGRTELAKRLKLAPPWLGVFVNTLKDVPANQVIARAEVLRLAGPGILECNRSSNIVDRLISANQLQPALAIWRTNCLSHASLVYDGAFDKFDPSRSATGFDWQVSSRGDVDVGMEEPVPGIHNLQLAVNAANTLPVLRQVVALTPGRYRLSWQMPGTSPTAALAMSSSLDCSPNLGTARAGQRTNASDGYSLVFVVDAACSSRQLIFWLAPKASVKIANVELKSLGAE